MSCLIQIIPISTLSFSYFYFDYAGKLRNYCTIFFHPDLGSQIYSFLRVIGVSPRQFKYHANYFININDFHTCSWHRHIWYFSTQHKIIHLFICNTCNKCQVIYTHIYIFINLHSAKRRTRYDPEKIVTHGYKLHV